MSDDQDCFCQDECPSPRTTYCDRDRRDNVWIEGGNRETGEGGVCILDNLVQDQVVWILERDYKARADLIRVTSDPQLQFLAHNIAPLPTGNAVDDEMHDANTNVPFYSVFRGQPPFAQ
jgi:hypothetical protein